MNDELSPAYLAIGGAMELTPESTLVKLFIQYSGGKNGKIVILPTASDFGHEIGPLYQQFFSELCDDVSYHLINKRGDANDPTLLEEIRTASSIFFTGGDQLKITSILGGSPIMKLVKQARENEIFIAGTSAGAAAMPSTMITYGPADSMLKGNLAMSPGIGLVKNMVFDSHFVRRGRISRLMHMVATNPGTLGVGLSEDTGILIDPSQQVFKVAGSRQAVVVDGRHSRHSNIASTKDNRPFSVTDVRVHVLGPQYSYDYGNHEIRLPQVETYHDQLEEPSKLTDLPYRPLKDDNW